MATYNFDSLVALSESQTNRFGGPCSYEAVGTITGDIFSDRVENSPIITGYAIKFPTNIRKGRERALEGFNLEDLAYFQIILKNNQRAEVDGILIFAGKKYKLVYVNTQSTDDLTVLYQSVYGKLESNE